MKRKTFFLSFVAILCVFALTSCGSSQKTGKGYSTEQEMNEKLAQYARDGKQIHGTSRTLKGKLIEHYAKMEANPNLQEVIGTSTGCHSITVCRASAQNAASVSYAVSMGQDLKGKAMRDMGVDESSAVPAEYNKFQEACISKFQASIQGDLQESYALIKEMGGTNNYEIYYLVDKEKARAKRTQAIKDALEESNLRQQYARSVEKFIDDDFDYSSN